MSEEELQIEKIKTDQLYIRGFELEELEKFNPVNYSQKQEEGIFQAIILF